MKTIRYAIPGRQRITVEEFTGTAHTTLYVARNGKLQGLIVLSTATRPDALKVINALRAEGIKYFILITWVVKV